jgi:ADP-heptose:LPS heptosyltransferase
MNRTLIVRACAIGDFVLNLPALKALHRLNDSVRFTLVGYPSTLNLARDFVPVDAIYSIETDPWWRLFYESIPGLSFESAVVWMKDPVVADNLRRSGVPTVFRADPFPDYGHAAAHLLRTLRLTEPPLPDLWKQETSEIIIHPSSGSAAKNWPYFEELAARLGESCRVLANGDQTLIEVSRRLRHCRAYIGNDSGITHLAAYLGVPTIALFGPTNPRTWGPIGRRARTIWKTKLEDISVDEILQTLKWMT